MDARRVSSWRSVSARLISMRWLSAVAILASCIGCDQATKAFAVRTLQDAEPRSYCGDMLRFEYAENPGGFLSLGGDLPKPVRRGIFLVFGGGLMVLVAGYLFSKRHGSPAMFAALALMLAGGIGNLIDRLTNDGLVTDFINVGVGQVRTGIFNVADMALMFGAGAAVLASFRADAGTTGRPVA